MRTSSLIGINKYDYKIKILMLGDSGVGKSSLLVRYSHGEFDQMLGTTGIDFKFNNIEIDKKKIKLEIWDTAGQERFRSITTKYYKGIMGILLVFDVSERNSFDNVSSWVSQIEDNTKDNEIIKFLIANKVDIRNRNVSEEEGKFLANKFNMAYYETSAKNDTNVNSAFLDMAEDIYKSPHILEKCIVKKDTLNNDRNKSKKAINCKC